MHTTQVVSLQLMSNVGQWMSEKTTSKVRCLINTAPLYGAFAPVAGVFLMTNAYLSYRLIAITFDYHMSFVDLNMHSEVTQQEKQSMKHQLKGIAEDEQKSYESLLPLPLYKLPEQSDCLPTHTKILLPKELEDAKTLVINEDSLDLFSTLAKKVRDETDKLNKTAIKSKERLGLQQKEFENQIKSLIEIYNKYQTYFSSEGKKAQEDVMQEITQKHAQLRLRMDNQIRLALTHCKEEMEEEWVEKMRIFSEKLTGTSGYVSRIQQLQKQLEQLNIQSRKERKFNPTNMSKSQLENLLSALKEQSDPINEIKQRLESLDKVVST
ncbi:hypothetical protein G6F56_004623 [Rhizopus delemar]|nr:hypothetical protein G6F56_004623 [Rhizopus delemar]